MGLHYTAKYQNKWHPQTNSASCLISNFGLYNARHSDIFRVFLKSGVFNALDAAVPKYDDSHVREFKWHLYVVLYKDPVYTVDMPKYLKNIFMFSSFKLH